MERITEIKQCISAEEKAKRSGIVFQNVVIWIFLAVITILLWGIPLVLALITWLGNWLLSEYNVRKLQAMGTAVTEDQFPEVSQALNEICEKFNIKKLPKVIIVQYSDINAMALKFARKKVIVLFSKTLEGVIDKPAELKFLLGHEIAHMILDHGTRGTFELYKNSAYKAARELTCDNCGLACSGDLEASKNAIKRLNVGNKLFDRLSDEYLIAEAQYIYSGLTGWLLKKHLTYPPFGKRLLSINGFFMQEAEVYAEEPVLEDEPVLNE
jgi:Zn-dependent protease with chaperone function